MRNRPGKIYGPAGLFLMTGALIVLFAVGGVAIGLTHGRIGEVGKQIKAVEREQEKLKAENRFIAAKLSEVTDSISLQKSVTERLQPPSPEQVVVVRRRSAPGPVMFRSVPRDPRFAALDIAYIRNTPAPGSPALR